MSGKSELKGESRGRNIEPRSFRSTRLARAAEFQDNVIPSSFADRAFQAG